MNYGHNHVYGIICHWELVADSWKLMESYSVDSDGYCLTKSSTGDTRHGWSLWAQKGDESFMGRAVTMWDAHKGISLMAFNPPSWCGWLAPTFYEELKKHTSWPSLLSGGFDLLFGTIRETEKYLTINKDKRNG